MKPKKIILLGAAGCGTAFAFALAIRKYWGNELHLILMDTNPEHLVAASVLSDGYIHAPKASSVRFGQFLTEHVFSRNNIIYLPLLPLEIYKASRLVENLKCADNVVVVPESKYSKIIYDKYLLFKYLSENNIEVPITSISPLKVTGKNIIAKPRYGYGSKNVLVYKNWKDAKAGVGVIFQEKCDPPEITVDAFFDPVKNFICTTCRERIEVKSGVCTKARVFYDQNMELLAENIARLLRIKGGFCFQVMQRGKQSVVIDVNPRLGAGTSMSSYASRSYFAATIAYYLQEDYYKYLPKICKTYYVVRQYSDIITKIEQYDNCS